MNKIALFLCVLCATLLGSNAYLLYVNHTLVRQHRVDEAMRLPMLDAPLTPITVRGAQGGERPLAFGSDARHAHLLLVMSPDCPYCEKNWPRWDALVKRLAPEVDVTYFDVTGKFDRKVSADHNIRDDQLISAPLDSAIRARIMGTPTTLLIGSDGTVKRIWQGVLSETEVGDVLAMATRS